MPRAEGTDPAVKKRISDALLQLLEEKPLAEITVTELTRRAGVSRMMYYRNYDSKEDVMNQRVAEIGRSFLDSLAGTRTKYESLVVGFCWIYEYREGLQRLMKAGMGTVLLQVVTDHMAETFCKETPEEQRRYLMPLYVGALYNIYCAWLENGAQEEPEEMARLVCSAFSIFAPGPPP